MDSDSDSSPVDTDSDSNPNDSYSDLVDSNTSLPQMCSVLALFSCFVMRTVHACRCTEFTALSSIYQCQSTRHVEDCDLPEMGQRFSNLHKVSLGSGRWFGFHMCCWCAWLIVLKHSSSGTPGSFQNPGSPSAHIPLCTGIRLYPIAYLHWKHQPQWCSCRLRGRSCLLKCTAWF